MTIYDIDREIERILSMTDEETGELPDSAFEELEQLQLSREEKIEGAACLALDLAAEAKAIREQELVLSERRRAKERRVESIKKYLSYATDGNPFSSPRVEVKWRRSTVVELDASAFFAGHPDSALIRTKDPEPDKEAIKAALKAGMEIPGAALIEKKTLSIK